MKKWLKKTFGKKKQETNATNTTSLREQLKTELREELREELKAELRQEMKEEAKQRISPSKSSTLSLVKKPSKAPLAIKQTCAHCQRPLLTSEGKIEHSNCKVSATNERGICYLACRCGCVSRFYPATLKLEVTGANMSEMKEAARLFEEVGLKPSRQSLTPH